MRRVRARISPPLRRLGPILLCHDPYYGGFAHQYLRPLFLWKIAGELNLARGALGLGGNCNSYLSDILQLGGGADPMAPMNPQDR